MNPDELLYTPEHEWLDIDGNVATVGITAYAAEKLGDVVFVELPDVDAAVTAGTVIGEIESTKSVGELFAPVDGTVTENNAAVVKNMVCERPMVASSVCSSRAMLTSAGLSMLAFNWNATQAARTATTRVTTGRRPVALMPDAPTRSGSTRRCGRTRRPPPPRPGHR